MDTSARITSIEPLLHDVFAKAGAGDYAEAFVLLEMARSADPDNIYFDALKKQLGLMITREKTEGLDEEQRQEMMEPLPGIIECALRDAHRQSRPGHVAVTPPPESEHAATPELTDPAEDEARKELEALKLIYFQRASKFVMKGDYEQALAEVKRVFIVDPDSTIARKYATRVEDLIRHARHLASAPVDGEPEAPAIAVPLSNPVQTPPVHSRHSTAWDDAFEAPVKTSSISQRRNAPPSSKETVAYGSTLEPSFRTARAPVTETREEIKHVRSRKTHTLVGVIVIFLVASGMFAVLMTVTAGGRSKSIAQVDQAAANINSLAVGTLGSQPAQEQVSFQQNQAAPPTSPPVKQPADEPRAKADPQPDVQHNELLPADINVSTSLLAVTTPEREEPRVTEMKPADPKGTPVDVPTFVAVEKEPQILKLEKPQFPSLLWKSFDEGTVVVRVLIDANGKPVDTQILKSTSSMFELPVIDALLKSKFAPGQMGSGPVSAWLTIPFRIKLPK